MKAFKSANQWALSLQFPSALCEHQRRATEELWSIIQPLQIRHVLDIGAGESGAALQDILVCNGLTVRSTDALTEGAERVDAHDLPFASNSFDLVVARHLLEHVLSPYVVLREMMRVSLRWLLVVVPEDIDRWRYWGGHLHILPRRAWEDMFWRLRLRIDKFEVGDFSEKRAAGLDLEWRWLLQKGVLTPLLGYKANGYYEGPYPALSVEDKVKL